MQGFRESLELVGSNIAEGVVGEIESLVITAVTIWAGIVVVIGFRYGRWIGRDVHGR